MNWRASNILDPIHETLDPRVFDDAGSPEPRLKKQHRTWILALVHKVLDDHGYSHVDDWMHLVLTGSLTTYQYSDESDVDVSVFVDVDKFPEWSRGEMIGVMTGNVDGQILPGTPHPMQCFVVPQGIAPQDLYKPGLRSGYDLREQRWIVPPEKDRVFDVKAQMHGAYVKAVEAADKMSRLLKYDPPRAVTYWHQIHKRRRDDQLRGLGDFTESNIIYKELANRGLFPEISEASGEYIAKVAAFGDKPEDWEGWSSDEPKGPWNHPPDRWSDEDWLQWNRDQVRPKVTKPDPNCKVCYGQGYLTGTDDKEYPCYRCMRGKTPPVTDLRKVDPRYLARTANWWPGQEAKAIVDTEGNAHLVHGMDTHARAAEKLGIRGRAWYWITRDGGVVWDSNFGTGADDVDKVVALRPEFHVAPDQQALWDRVWKGSKTWDPREWVRQQHDDPNLVTTPARLVGMPWVPGYYGKALQDADGVLHTWNVEERGGIPHHGDVAEGLPRGEYYNPIRIMPDGSLDPQRPINPREFHPTYYPSIFEQEPRLRYAPPNTNDPRAAPDPSFNNWTLGATEEPIEKKLKEYAAGIKHCGDYGYLYWHPEDKKAHWTAGDADGPPEYDDPNDIEAGLRKIDGVADAQIGDEGGPARDPEAEGWVQLWPDRTKTATNWTDYYRQVEEQPEPEIVPWEPGTPGKAFLDPTTGKVHTWKTDAPDDKPSVGIPHHTWVAKKLGMNEMRASAWISPGGSVEFPYLDSEPSSEAEQRAVLDHIARRTSHVKRGLGDPRLTIVRKWVYNGDTGELAVGEEAPEEGAALSHAQLAEQLGVGPDTPWIGGTISRTGWVSTEVGHDRNKVRVPAHQALREQVPDIEGFVGGEAQPISDPEPVQMLDWSL